MIACNTMPTRLGTLCDADLPAGVLDDNRQDQDNREDLEGVNMAVKCFCFRLELLRYRRAPGIAD